MSVIEVKDEHGKMHRVAEEAVQSYCIGCASDSKEKRCTHGLARHIGRPWIGKACEFKTTCGRGK